MLQEFPPIIHCDKAHHIPPTGLSVTIDGGRYVDEIQVCHGIECREVFARTLVEPNITVEAICR